MPAVLSESGMQQLFSTQLEMQLDPDQRERCALIREGIKAFLTQEGIDPETIATFGDFARSDYWNEYIYRRAKDPEAYPLFEVETPAFFVSDIDFIHAYCADGNSLSSLINTSEDEPVSAETLLGQVFFYGLGSVATWFNRHPPRLAQIKAFELVLMNLMEAERSMSGQLREEIFDRSPFMTPRISSLELQFQGLAKGMFGSFRNYRDPHFTQELLNVLFNPLDTANVKAYENALRQAYDIIGAEGGLCPEAKTEIAQNLLVASILNPGFFMVVSNEPLAAIVESIQAKSNVWAKAFGHAPKQVVPQVLLTLLCFDPELLAEAKLENRNWYAPGDAGVHQLSGPLVGMCGYQGIPFSATYAFLCTHYGDEVFDAVLTMFYHDHPHIKSTLSADEGYHPVADRLLSQNALSFTALSHVGSELVKFPKTVSRYDPCAMKNAAVTLFEQGSALAWGDREFLKVIVRNSDEARQLIVDRVGKQKSICLSDLVDNGLTSSDSHLLIARLSKRDQEDTLNMDIGL